MLALLHYCQIKQLLDFGGVCNFEVNPIDVWDDSLLLCQETIFHPTLLVYPWQALQPRKIAWSRCNLVLHVHHFLPSSAINFFFFTFFFFYTFLSSSFLFSSGSFSFFFATFFSFFCTFYLISFFFLNLQISSFARPTYLLLLLLLLLLLCLISSSFFFFPFLVLRGHHQ